MLFISPGFYVLLSGAVLLYALGRNFKRWRWLALVWAILFYMLSTPFLFHYCARQLEQPFPPLHTELIQSQRKEGDTVFVYVLGAGQAYDHRLFPSQRLNGTAVRRLAEGIRIAGKIPGSLLVTSANGRPGFPAQAETSRQAALMLGMDSARVLMNPEPHDTESEAKTFVTRFGTGHPVILVSSASHLRRAEAWFRKAGCKQVIPAGAEYLVTGESDFKPGHFLPSVGKLMSWEVLMKEWVGYLEIEWTE